MLKIDKDICLHVYKNYAAGFEPFSDGDKLKMIHTNYVAQNCVLLAEQYCQEYIDLAWLIGLLHDLGRFEQLQNYNSFKDDKTVDHANLCIEILFNRGLIDEFSSSFSGCTKDIEQAKEIIQSAIYNHNKKEIETGLDSLTLTMCQIVRDADKIDIFRVCATEDLTVVYGASRQEIENSILSKSIYDIAIKQTVVPYPLRQSYADDVVSHLNFIYDLNFKKSLDIVKNQGYFKKMRDFNFKDEQTKQAFEDVCNKLPI